MREWLIGPGVAAAVMVAAWALMVVLAKRLPPGPLKEIVAFIPDCVTTIRRLRGHPAVPGRAKAAVILAGLYLASPIDLIPEFVPVIGPLDDAVVVALVLRYASRRVPREVILDAWPGEKRIIQRLLGTRADVSRY